MRAPTIGRWLAGRRGRPRIRGSGPDYLAYALIDAVIDGYFPVLEAYGDRLLDLEEKLLQDTGEVQIAELYDLKQQLLKLRLVIRPLRELTGSLLRSESSFITEPTRPFLRDCYDHAMQIVDQIEQMDDAINEEYRTVEMAMLVAPEVFKMYRRKYRALAGFHPGNPDTDKEDEIKLDGSSTTLISCPGMRSSQRIILTPKSNLYYAYDDPSDDSVFEMEQNHRQLDVWCDYWGGVGFLIFDPRIVYINDQA